MEDPKEEEVAHEQIKNPIEEEYLRIPLWYGDKKKDIFNALEWVTFVQRAKDLFNWTNETTMLFVLNALSDGAYDWFHEQVHGLKNC